MTDETKIGAEDAGEKQGSEPVGGEKPEAAHSQSRNPMQLPGLVAIALYLVVLAGVVIVGVAGGHYPPLFLFFPAFFFAAAGGLMFLFRWAWALTLAAVLLMAVVNLWIFSHQHVAPALVQGLLNWVFFLYLIRTQVRSKLR